MGSLLSLAKVKSETFIMTVLPKIQKEKKLFSFFFGSSGCVLQFDPKRSGGAVDLAAEKIQREQEQQHHGF